MIRRASVERRRRDRRAMDEGDHFWRTLHDDRRVGERRENAESSATDAADAPNSIASNSIASNNVVPIIDEQNRATQADSGVSARRMALKNMLDAAEARIARAQRMRRPVLTKGALVRVTRGEHAGREGTVEDADYIESRVLLRLDPAEQPCWVGFARVGHAGKRV